MKNTTIDLKKLSWRIVLGALALTALPAATGCQKAPADEVESMPLGDAFAPDNEPRHLHRIFDAQAASGARYNATLHACHFDGGNPSALNSLGEDKLDLMVADDDALPLIVHLDVPGATDELTAARTQSVTIYLKDRGLHDAQIKVVNGRNTATYSPTAPKIKAATTVDAAPVPGAGSGASMGGSK